MYARQGLIRLEELECPRAQAVSLNPWGRTCGVRTTDYGLRLRSADLTCRRAEQVRVAGRIDPGGSTRTARDGAGALGLELGRRFGIDAAPQTTHHAFEARKRQLGVELLLEAIGRSGAERCRTGAGSCRTGADWSRRSTESCRTDAWRGGNRRGIDARPGARARRRTRGRPATFARPGTFARRSARARPGPFAKLGIRGRRGRCGRLGIRSRSGIGKAGGVGRRQCWCYSSGRHVGVSLGVSPGTSACCEQADSNEGAPRVSLTAGPRGPFN
jgi:hypothetical protein